MRDLLKLPGNARLATALLQVLADTGEHGRRTRAERALGDDGALGRRRADWIRPELLREIFHDVGVDDRLARRIGRLLVSPRRIGLLLCYAGVATPEKAYRRTDQLLARERPGGRFVATEIKDEWALIEFRPKDPNPDDAIFCSVRQGMLEAIPTLYGLLPAKARETACAHRGATSCRFEVAWRSVSRTWVATGGATGIAVGAAFGAAIGGANALVWAIATALAIGLLGAAAGRSIDLARQLKAVAGSRLGQLAMLDQVDGMLAEKMDVLAKLDRLPDGAEGVSTDTSATSPLGQDLDRGEQGEAGQSAGRVGPNLLHRFNGALATLQATLSSLSDRGDDTSGQQSKLVVCDAATRELRAIGVELSECSEAAGDRPETACLAEIARRGIAAVSPSQPDTLEIVVAIEVEPAPIRCHPFQLEQVVVQLLMNAAEATRAEGRIDVVVRSSPDGYELAVTDAGEGIDPEILDRLFDPFFAPSAAGAESGLGLTLCYRVVDRHGGELSVQSEPGCGTTVTVMLPANWDETAD